MRIDCRIRLAAARRGNVRGALKRVGLRIVVDRVVYDPRPLAE